MTTMAKMVLLLLAVFNATAFQTSPSPSPLSNPPFPSPSLAPSLSPLSNPPFPSPSLAPSPLSNPPFPSPSLAPSLSPFSNSPSSSPFPSPTLSPAPSPALEPETPPAPAPAPIPEEQTPPPPPPAPIVVPPPPTPEIPPPVLPSPPPPSAKELCAMDCAITCMRKRFSFLKKICMVLCLVKCSLIPSDSLPDINCTLDCAQSSTNHLHYDANKMDDHISSCYQQCKRD